MVTPAGTDTTYEHLVKTTENTEYGKLLKAAGGDPEALAKALVAGDPEIDLQKVGQRLGDAMRVYIRPDGTVLYAARILQVVIGPDGVEKSRADFIDVDANVGEELPPVAWTGKLVPLDEAVRKFAFTRKVLLRHINGLTFDFLYGIAKTLHDAGKLLLVGAGPKAAPLIFSQNGTAYHGFLEGRVEGEAYKLVLHLTNIELKSVLGEG
jgi:hypothetical protein